MRVWAQRAAAVGLVAFVAAAAGCRNPLGRQYEYEEQMYLGVDGQAQVVIDTSMPALVALRGVPIDPSPRVPIDRDQVRRLFSVAGCSNVRVGQPWIRRGRRFIQIRVTAPKVTDLKACGPLAWASYTFERQGNVIHFQQEIGPAASGNPGSVNWDGSEIVAFKLHLPSKIIFQNVKRLEDGSNGTTERGNILTWEQRLSDRRAGVPLSMEVRMDSQSILYRTLWLFAGAFVAAVVVLIVLIWMTMRKARGGALGRHGTDSPVRRNP